MPGNRAIDTIFRHIDEKDSVGSLFRKLAAEGLTGHPDQVNDWQTIEILLVDLLRVVREDRAYRWKVTGTESTESLEDEVRRRVRHHFTSAQSRITVEELNRLLRLVLTERERQEGRPSQLALEPAFEPVDYRDAGLVRAAKPVTFWDLARAFFRGLR